MKYNYSKLRGRIVEKCGTNSNFGRKMEFSERTLSLKLNNKIDWKQSEIAKACTILDIDNSEVALYFFCE